MQRDKELGDFTKSVEALRKERFTPGVRSARPGIDPNVYQRLLKIMRPVIQAMLDGDSLLSLQSEPSSQFPGFYLAYANSHPYHIVVKTANEHEVSLQVAVSRPSVAPQVYQGPLDEQAIRQALMESLSAWYKALA